MFQLSVQDIHPGQQAGTKEEAIRQIAAALAEAGNVAGGYVDGMLAREQQTSTFLGNGSPFLTGRLIPATGVENRRQSVPVPARHSLGEGGSPMWLSVLPPVLMNTGPAASANPRPER